MSAVRDVVVLTPEHVPVILVPAGLGSRACALMLDAAFAVGISGICLAVTGALLPDALRAATGVTLPFVVMSGYHVLFDLRFEGRSPGKRALGLRVMDARGLPVTLQQSAVRSVVRVLDFLPFGYGLGAVAAFLDPHGRRLGDIAAGTLVVDERGAALQAARLPPSRRYNSLRTPRVLRMIKHRLGLEERELLVALCLRAERLDPQARYDLMAEAAARFREWLEIDDEDLPPEALIRDLASLATGER